jgi:prepilin-type N-terminal cleavage/methylation domain-containing protein
MLMKNSIARQAECKLKREDGFSLVEVVVALLVMTVLAMGTLTVFTYTVQHNRGNNIRSQSLSILQQEAEIYRSAKFTATITDSSLLGGTKTAKTVTSADGTVFEVNITVDNDPTTPTVIDSSETLSSGAACTLKEIKIAVTPKSAEAAWITFIKTDVTIQRVRGN